MTTPLTHDGVADCTCTAFGWCTRRRTSISLRKSPSAIEELVLRIFAATSVPHHIALCTMPNSPSPVHPHTRCVQPIHHKCA